MNSCSAANCGTLIEGRSIATWSSNGGLRCNSLLKSAISLIYAMFQVGRTVRISSWRMPLFRAHSQTMGTNQFGCALEPLTLTDVVCIQEGWWLASKARCCVQTCFAVRGTSYNVTWTYLLRTNDVDLTATTTLTKSWLTIYCSGLLSQQNSYHFCSSCTALRCLSNFRNSSADRVKY